MSEPEDWTGQWDTFGSYSQRIEYLQRLWPGLLRELATLDRAALVAAVEGLALYDPKANTLADAAESMRTRVLVLLTTLPEVEP